MLNTRHRQQQNYYFPLGATRQDIHRTISINAAFRSSSSPWPRLRRPEERLATRTARRLHRHCAPPLSPRAAVVEGAGAGSEVEGGSAGAAAGGVWERPLCFPSFAGSTPAAVTACTAVAAKTTAKSSMKTKEPLGENGMVRERCACSDKDKITSDDPVTTDKSVRTGEWRWHCLAAA